MSDYVTLVSTINFFFIPRNNKFALKFFNIVHKYNLIFYTFLTYTAHPTRSDINLIFLFLLFFILVINTMTAMYTNNQLSIIFSTLFSGEHKPAAQRKLVLKLSKKLEKDESDFDSILSILRPKPGSSLTKPKNAWQLFLAEFRSNMKDGVAGSEQTKLASAAWKDMDSDQKKPYEDEAAIQSAKYKLEKEKIDGPKKVRGRGRPKKEEVIDLSDDMLDSDDEDEQHDEHHDEHHDEQHENQVDELPKPNNNPVIKEKFKGIVNMAIAKDNLDKNKHEQPKDLTKDQKKDQSKKKKEQVDNEFWGEFDELDWTKLNFSDDKSNKFWSITISDNRVLTHFGKIGKDGAYTQKTFDSPERANKFMLSEISKKEKNGYN